MKMSKIAAIVLATMTSTAAMANGIGANNIVDFNANNSAHASMNAWLKAHSTKLVESDFESQPVTVNPVDAQRVNVSGTSQILAPQPASALVTPAAGPAVKYVEANESKTVVPADRTSDVRSTGVQYVTPAAGPAVKYVEANESKTVVPADRTSDVRSTGVQYVTPAAGPAVKLVDANESAVIVPNDSRTSTAPATALVTPAAGTSVKVAADERTSITGTTQTVTAQAASALVTPATGSSVKVATDERTSTAPATALVIPAAGTSVKVAADERTSIVRPVETVTQHATTRDAAPEEHSADFYPLQAGVKQAQNTGAYAHARIDAANQHIAENRAALEAENARIAQNSADIASNRQQLGQFEQSTNSKFANMDKKIDENRKHASRGIAGANALAGLPQLNQDDSFGVAAAAGGYDGESAVAVGASAHPFANKAVTLKAGVTTSTGGNMGWNVGAGYSW